MLFITIIAPIYDTARYNDFSCNINMAWIPNKSSNTNIDTLFEIKTLLCGKNSRPFATYRAGATSNHKKVKKTNLRIPRKTEAVEGERVRRVVAVGEAYLHVERGVVIATTTDHATRADCRVRSFP